MTDTTKITDKLAEGILTTAVEGGSAYWAEGRKCRRHAHIHQDPDRALSVYAIDLRDKESDEEETDPWHPVTLDTIRLGVQRILDRSLQHGQVSNQYHLRACVILAAGDPHDELDYDAETADLIVQAGIFNEIVYG